MLAAPRREFPQFPAALSFAMLLTPQAAEAALARRAEVLRGRLTELEEELPRHSARLPRVVLLDDEYRRAVTAAELAWIDGVLADLRTGVLTWSREQLASVAMEDLGLLATDLPPEYTLDAEPARPARPDARRRPG